MLDKMTKVLLISLLAILLQAGSAIVVLADNNKFGASCALPTMPGDSTYLAQTAYGYMLSNISMPCTSMSACTTGQSSTSTTPCCAPRSNCQDTGTTNLTLCIRTSPSPDATTCTLITMTANSGYSINLSNLYGSFMSGSPAGASGAEVVKVAVKSMGGKLCLTMPTPYGDTPLVCKAAPDGSGNTPSRDVPQCTPLSPACYGASTHSQSPFNFSGQAFECLTGSLNNIFFQKNSCGNVSNQVDTNLLSSFPSFQNALRVGIGAAMIIYMIFFGVRLALGEEKISLSNLSMAAIKLILVTYFAVGLGPLQYVNNQLQSTNNGTTDVALPILNEAMVDFAQIVFNAGGAQGLCAFDGTKYADGYAYYSLFDAIDCRIAYYLGMQMMSSKIDGATSSGSTASGTEWSWNIQSSSGPATIGLTNTEFFGFFWMLFGLLLGGNFVILIFSLVFLIVFLGIVLHFISSFLICVITLYVMIYVSPIFVTFALFNRTKGYFDSWLKILVSCALQPAILAGFLALVITMFDSGMYNTCEFNRYTVDTSTNSLSTFVLVIPNGDTACQESVGYKMMRYYQGDGWDSFGLLLFTIHFINVFSDQIMSIGDMTALGLLCIIFYFFSGTMSDFASELTGGPNMKGVTVSASGAIGKIIDKAKEAYGKAKAAISASAGDAAGGGGSKAGDSGGGSDSSKASDSGGGSDSSKAGDSGGGGGSDKASDKGGG